MRTQGTTLSLCFEASKEQVRKGRMGPSSRAEHAGLQLLIDHYSLRVEAFAAALLGSHQLADEVCLNVFARARTSLAGSREPWSDLVRLSIRQCWRARWFRWASWNASRWDSNDDDFSLLQVLPWNQRILLALREVAGLSLDQMATVLERPVGDIRAGLLKAREQLLTKARGINETKH